MAASEVELERLVVRFVGDIDEYLKTLQQAETATKAAVDEISAALGNVEAATQAIGGSTEIYARQAEEVRKLGGNLKTLQEAQTITKTAGDEISAALGRGEAATRAVENATERYARQTKEVRDLLAQESITLETANRLFMKYTEEKNKALQIEASAPAKQLGQMAYQFQATSIRAGAAFKDLMAVMRGQTETTGDSLRALGGIADLIPGVWGQVSGAVIGSLAAIDDAVEMQFNKAEKAAQSAFMAIADGAKTAEKAINDINVDGLKEGLKEIATIKSRSGMSEFLAGLGNFVTLGIAGGPEMGETREENVQRVKDRMRENISLAQEQLRLKREDAEVGQLLTEEVLMRVGGGAEERAREMQRRSAQRQMMQAMHGRGAVDEEHIRRLTQQTILEEVSVGLNRDIVAGSQEELALRERINRTAELNVRAARNMRRERLTMQIEGPEAQEKHLAQLGKLRDATRVLQATQEGAAAHVTAAMKLQLADERELEKVRREGTSAQVEIVRNRQDQIRVQTLHNETLQDANKTLQQVRFPVEKYNDEMERLQHLCDAAAISQETLDRAIRNAQVTYLHSREDVKEYYKNVEKGVGIVTSMRTPEQKLKDQLQELDAALADARITTREYENAWLKVTTAADRAGASLKSVTGILAGSADAAQAIAQFNLATGPITRRPSYGTGGRPEDLGEMPEWIADAIFGPEGVGAPAPVAPPGLGGGPGLFSSIGGALGGIGSSIAGILGPTPLPPIASTLPPGYAEDERITAERQRVAALQEQIAARERENADLAERERARRMGREAIGTPEEREAHRTRPSTAREEVALGLRPDPVIVALLQQIATGTNRPPIAVAPADIDATEGGGDF
jgi:hypothetical protein